MHTEISAALRTDIQIVAHIFHIDRLTALITLSPESLWDVRLFFALSLTVSVNHGICLFKHIFKHTGFSLIGVRHRKKLPCALLHYLQYSGN